MTCFSARNSRRLITATLALLSIPYSLTSFADEDDAFNILAGAGVRYEDNLFRVDDGAALGNASKHDWVYTTNAGIKFDKVYSLQHVQLEATVTDNKYQENDFLDWTGFNYRAAWLWSITPRLTGTLV
ncbi:MAG TPA: exopolysaccharide biosynthesis protein, partial [Methylophilaceae bacterium]|nr:exopolysaccharide biosynthesis protein [Methylophilaceae bacterium]